MVEIQSTLNTMIAKQTLYGKFIVIEIIFLILRDVVVKNLSKDVIIECSGFRLS